MKNHLKLISLIIALAFMVIIPRPSVANITIVADDDWFGNPSWATYTATTSDNNVYTITNTDQDAGYSFSFNKTSGVISSITNQKASVVVPSEIDGASQVAWTHTLYEAMGGVYNDAAYTSFVENYRPQYGPHSGGSYHHIAWLYPTLTYQALQLNAEQK